MFTPSFSACNRACKFENSANAVGCKVVPAKAAFGGDLVSFNGWGGAEYPVSTKVDGTEEPEEPKKSSQVGVGNQLLLFSLLAIICIILIALPIGLVTKIS